MLSDAVFPSLEGFEPTRRTLQLYSRVISAVPRAYGEFHPKWWHVSLRVQPDGLITEKVLLPDGSELRLKMDLEDHRILMLVDDRAEETFSMLAGRSSSVLADDVLDVVARLGLEGEVDRSKFENGAPRDYDRAQARTFLAALVNADRVFKAHRSTLSGKVGPVQLWPHGFDLAFEWFGSRIEEYEEEGEVQRIPAQLNLGFYPGSPGVAPYFYSNPWPFEAAALLGEPLPAGVMWHTEGWQGAYLSYEALVEDGSAEERLLAFAARVFEVSAPTLGQGWETGST
jgi:hypothetical protein